MKSLLTIVSTGMDDFGFRRDRAAATIAVLAKEADAREFFLKNALEPLRAMFLTTTDRWEKRDSATALLMLFSEVRDLQPTYDPVAGYSCKIWLIRN